MNEFEVLMVMHRSGLVPLIEVPFLLCLIGSERIWWRRLLLLCLVFVVLLKCFTVVIR